MSIALQRSESLALRELSLILLKDSKNEFLKKITITEVRIKNDLSLMSIYYTFYDGKKEDYEKALEEAKGYLRSALAKKIKLRKMPDLLFIYDESLEYGNHIYDVLDKLKETK